jgi:hypothetical protein
LNGFSTTLRFSICLSIRLFHFPNYSSDLKHILYGSFYRPQKKMAEIRIWIKLNVWTLENTELFIISFENIYTHANNNQN